LVEEGELQAYKDHLREGLIKYTRRAFQILPQRPIARILDIGCGSGVPTMELARLSDGEIIAIDINQAVLDRLASKVKKAGLTNRVRIEKCSMFNMDFADESFDVIWAEGSIGAIGFERGLKEWRRFLKTGGVLVVHDALGNLTEKLEQISQCGYELTDHFVLSENIWWDEYCAPLENNLNEIRAKHADDLKIIALLDGDQREIAEFKKNPELNSSVFFIMKKGRRGY